MQSFCNPCYLILLCAHKLVSRRAYSLSLLLLRNWTKALTPSHTWVIWTQTNACVCVTTGFLRQSNVWIVYYPTDNQYSCVSSRTIYLLTRWLKRTYMRTLDRTRTYIHTYVQYKQTHESSWSSPAKKPFISTRVRTAEQWLIILLTFKLSI